MVAAVRKKKTLAPSPKLGTQVAELLKRRILSGAYAPGDMLPPELALAEDLAVNRFTVREAMNQLEQLRLIERRAGVGTEVLDYSEHASVDVIEYLAVTPEGVVNTEVLKNLLEVARILSADIAELAAKRRNDDDLRALDHIVAEMRSEKNLSRLLWLDFDFNWALAGAAKNVVPRLLMNSVRGLLKKYTPYLETLWVSPGTITEGYEHVVEAVRSGDAERARSLLLWIWSSRHERFVDSVGRKSRPPGP
ncbi:MAG: FadR family transcriptional regulator [Polyangiaceae bacterium]|nr:FadR family transcriptional regulator [Polyangiaceae bacterium]MBK8998199.1 FadR family transcriptional regulator [Myxococcales bacterium]MCE7892680.1 FadR family transcriptional regulator [Sorangiineae bacterium PRO1]MCL4748937.1 GntR family transcriptional regulator [Myxococcales bacterium]